MGPRLCSPFTISDDARGERKYGQPPKNNNAISVPGEQITEAEFQHAVAKFRTAGLKLIRAWHWWSSRTLMKASNPMPEGSVRRHGGDSQSKAILKASASHLLGRGLGAVFVFPSYSHGILMVFSSCSPVVPSVTPRRLHRANGWFSPRWFGCTLL